MDRKPGSQPGNTGSIPVDPTKRFPEVLAYVDVCFKELVKYYKNSSTRSIHLSCYNKLDAKSEQKWRLIERTSNMAETEYSDLCTLTFEQAKYLQDTHGIRDLFWDYLRND